jgi:predicted transposase YbfD/YdcC
MKKTFNYKDLNLVKYYNFGTTCISIKDSLKNSKDRVSEHVNFKHILETLGDFKSKTCQYQTCRSGRPQELQY